MLTAITNIKALLQTRPQSVDRVAGRDMDHLPHLENAYLIIENGRIHSFGTMDALPDLQYDERIDATGRLVLPSWIDSHTHLVFAASREQAIVARIKCLSSAHLAARGVGILPSAARLSASWPDVRVVVALDRW